MSVSAKSSLKFTASVPPCLTLLNKFVYDTLTNILFDSELCLCECVCAALPLCRLKPDRPAELTCFSLIDTAT